MNPDWIIPDWPAPPWVGAVCTTRAGGVSGPPYDKLNLGDHVGDIAGDVIANRTNFAAQIGARPVFLNQVHRFDVVRLRHAASQGLVADACMTRQPGVACTIMVADCLPVLFVNRLGTVVAAAHVGWRGLLGAPRGANWVGVLETCLGEFKAQALGMAEQNSAAAIGKDVLAWLGPCIGPQKFEVGAEVRDAFLAQNPANGSFFGDAGQGQAVRDKWLADLPGLARLRLQGLGISQISGNDGGQVWCTASDASRFFSHRRDHQSLGSSGRMAAAVWLR